jgi:hypothetical protein
LELAAKGKVDALEQLHAALYSYQYNVKIVGIPQQKLKESAYDTNRLYALFGSLQNMI